MMLSRLDRICIYTLRESRNLRSKRQQNKQQKNLLYCRRQRLGGRPWGHSPHMRAPRGRDLSLATRRQPRLRLFKSLSTVLGPPCGSLRPRGPAPARRPSPAPRAPPWPPATCRRGQVRLVHTICKGLMATLLGLGPNLCGLPNRGS